MTGPISFGNDRSIGSGATETQLDIHAGKVDIRMIPENAVGNDISKCVNIRDTGTGALYPIATATPPQEFDLPLAEGFADNGGACYCKTQEGIVYVNAVLKSDTTREATSVGCVVGTLPAGFRPSNPVYTATLFDTGDMGGRILGKLAVRTNGQIVVANVTSSWDRCFGYIVFVAAS